MSTFVFEKYFPFLETLKSLTAGGFHEKPNLMESFEANKLTFHALSNLDPFANL